MHAGQFNRLVTIQSPDAGQDAIGQPVTTWSTFATAWANIKHLSGVETIRAGAETSAVKTSIRLRSYRTDLTSAMRVVHGVTVYQIKAVMPDEEGRAFTDLACEIVV